jgi:hypothetical protein
MLCNSRQTLGIQSGLRVTVPCVEPEKPEDTQVIFTNTLTRVFNEAHTPRLEIRQTAQGVDHRTVRPGVKRVHREIAAPRILAGVMVMPALVAVANAVGILAGIVSARFSVGLGAESFLYGARLFWHSYDLFYSLMKALCFGFLIPLVAVHMGLRTTGGAEGVGRATTASVVMMILAVLISDAIFPPLFLN